MILVPIPHVSAESSATVRSQIAAAYTSVADAEQQGGNVTSLVAVLNSAVSLVQEADSINGSNPSEAQTLYAQASGLAQQVIQSSPGVGAAGAAALSAAQLWLAIDTAVLVLMAAVAYLYPPRLFWSAWLRAHRNWRGS